jgi:restriction endonuclease S subunit
MDESSSDWTGKRIGSFAIVKRGASPRPIDNPRWFSHEGPGWVRIRDVTAAGDRLRQTQDHLSSEGASRSVPVEPGDVIMSIAATIGLSIIVDMDARIHDGFVKISPDDSVDPEFLVRLLRHSKARFLASGQTGTQSNINSRIVADTVVRLPPLEEQRRITEILDTIDETIQATERVVAKLELVLDGVAQDVKLGDPGDGAAAEMLGSFSSSRSGNTPARSVERYFGGGIPWVKSGEVAGPTILSTGETVSASAVRDYGLRLVRPGTPLVAMYGATAGKVGWLGIEAATNQAVLAIGTHVERADPRWLYWALRTSMARSINSTQGSGQPNLNKGIIERMAFALPGLAEQRIVADRLDSAEAAIEKYIAEHEKLCGVRSGIASDLLSGRVRTVAT